LPENRVDEFEELRLEAQEVAKTVKPDSCGIIRSALYDAGRCRYRYYLSVDRSKEGELTYSIRDQDRGTFDSTFSDLRQAWERFEVEVEDFIDPLGEL
jgi:hypothetical protein